MTLTSDIILTYPLWDKADTELCSQNGKYDFFSRLVDLFIVACAIGIRADKTITDYEPLDPPKSIGRTTYLSSINQDLSEILGFMLQNAILHSSTIDCDEEERLKLAFDPEYDNKMFSSAAFLTGFANYGLEEIYNHINSEVDTIAIDELNEFFMSMTKPDYSDAVELLTLDD